MGWRHFAALMRKNYILKVRPLRQPPRLAKPLPALMRVLRPPTVMQKRALGATLCECLLPVGFVAIMIGEVARHCRTACPTQSAYTRNTTDRDARPSDLATSCGRGLDTHQRRGRSRPGRRSATLR